MSVPMVIGPTSDFQRGVDGQPRMVWAKYETPFNAGWSHGNGNPFMRYPGQRLTRESAAVAEVGNSLLLSDPIIANVVEALATHAVGTGLTPSSKPDAVALGITPEAARDLGTLINKRFATWAGNPLECDLSGRHNLHAQATAGFKSYLLNGELLATVDVRRCHGAETLTKVALLDPRQCDRTKTVVDGSGGSWNGVAYDEVGRVRGYWLRTIVAGNLNAAPMPVLVPAMTEWGRPKVIMLWDIALPGQGRGISPIAAALTPAHESNALQEYTLDGAMIHAAFAMSVESDLPSDIALGKMDTGTAPLGLPGWESYRAAYYGNVKINPKPGTINHLAPGDKLKMNTAASPSSTYQAFDSALIRRAAKAAGAMVEDISGDYSKTSFSASRMASELPHRINMRRRAQIVERFYQLVFSAWLEEQIETGAIAVPAGAPPFWKARAAYTACRWNGLGRMSPDPKKQAEADVLQLNNHLNTHTDILAERGIDFDEMVERRKYETDTLRAAGLLGMPTEPGAVTTQVRDNVDQPPEPEEK